jgi:serine-type D-Ala-D-Ala carboxypeptidase/endopeptidase (penicillin-binding protein 4)
MLRRREFRAARGRAFCLREAAALFLLAGLSVPPAGARPHGPRGLERRINAILNASPARHGFWAVVVAGLPNGKELYSQNARHLFQPASNLKLFTTAAALEELGPDFTTLTTVESDSPPDAEGRVGNLYIVGRGDANFASSRVLPYSGPKTKRNPEASLDAVNDLARQIASHGVRRVAGNLIADATYFTHEPYPPDWAVDDMVWGYGAPVTALVFNDNTLLLDITPAVAAGEKASISIEPVDGGYKITNNLMTGPAGTDGDVELARAPGSNGLDVNGALPVGAPVDKETVAIQNPPKVIAELLHQDLEEEGIPVEGEIEVHNQPPAAVAAPAKGVNHDVLAERRSLPLRDDVVLTDKVSQNLHAEILLRLLGRKVEDQGTREAGLKALSKFASGIGIAAGELNIVDGSGLSRQDLVAPQGIVTLLVVMARSPRFEDFYDALPVAGVDGTLSDRFKGTPLAGRLHAKTGTIEHVNALSGYMDLPRNRRLAISIIGNADPLKSSQAEVLIDKIVLEIFSYYSRRHW